MLSLSDTPGHTFILLTSFFRFSRDAMVEVEVEEGEEFVLCEVADGKVGLDQCKNLLKVII